MRRYGGAGFLGDGKFVDPHTFEFDGKKITSKKFVTSTGSRVVAIPVKGLENIQYLTSESALELDYLPKSMIILGAGPIGLELAQVFTRFGPRSPYWKRWGRYCRVRIKRFPIPLKRFLRKRGLQYILVLM
ncbi:MAG: hypothetical protein E3K36_07585 [Candidatus Brocadia sp.]|nr:hypothetical protein [Candidatus Brocadia sp.]